MSKELPQSQQSEEVDLGQLFKLIGRFFEKISDFIKRISFFLFNLLVKLLIVLKENIIKFLIIGVGSFLIGFGIDFFNDKSYSSNMNIRPNFSSTNQIYSDIHYYNGLVQNSDSVALSNVFGITQKEAASITTFDIQPIRDENELLEKYNDFNIKIDTASVPTLSFRDFKKNINPVKFNSHSIVVTSKDPFVFKKLEDSIFVGNLLTNRYLNNKRKEELESYIIKDSALVKQERKIDSLRILYNKVMLKNVEKVTSSGTNIQFASSQAKTNEMELFQLEERIKKERLELNLDKATNYDMVNILSGFQKRGVEVELQFMEKKSVLLFSLSMIFLFVFLLFKGLNKYLNNYKIKTNA